MNTLSHKFLLIGLFFSALLLFNACGTTKSLPHNSTSQLSASMSKAKLVSAVEANYLSCQSIRSTGRAVLSVKGSSYRLKVDFSLLKGRGIRLLAYPFPLIEVGRVWLDKEGITIVDKINKVYSHASFEDLSSMLGISLSYEAIESLFLGQLFKADGTAITPLQLNIEQIAANSAMISYFDASDYHYLSTVNRQLRPSSIRVEAPDGKAYLLANYSQFDDANSNGLIAKQMLLRLQEGASQLFSLDLQHERIRWNELNAEVLNIRISTNYQAVPLRFFFNSLK